ncbi:MAG: hypothetical protein HXO21_04650 [Prevotella sp.]|nr:hypothetical protein [Prevotella sp.]
MGRLIALNDIIRSKQYSCCMLHAGGTVMGNTEKDAFMSCSTILSEASWCFTDEARCSQPMVGKDRHHCS